MWPVSYTHLDVYKRQIHKSMKVGKETFRYCGTLLSCSVSEAGQQKGILMVDIKEKEKAPEITVLPLMPLRQVRVAKGSLEEVLQQKSQDYVTVILTDKADLDVIDMQDRLRLAFPYLLEMCIRDSFCTDLDADYICTGRFAYV